MTDKPEVCPECGSTEVLDAHADASFAYPETNYKICEECDHQWGHQ